MSFPRWPKMTGTLGASKKVKPVPAVDPADSNIEMADFQGMPRCYESGLHMIPLHATLFRCQKPCLHEAAARCHTSGHSLLRWSIFLSVMQFCKQGYTHRSHNDMLHSGGRLMVLT